MHHNPLKRGWITLEEAVTVVDVKGDTDKIRRWCREQKVVNAKIGSEMGGVYVVRKDSLINRARKLGYEVLTDNEQVA